MGVTVEVVGGSLEDGKISYRYRNHKGYMKAEEESLAGIKATGGLQEVEAAIDRANCPAAFESDEPILTPLFWDCECEDTYIHSKEVTQCDRCDAHVDEQPESRLSEVLEWVERGS